MLRFKVLFVMVVPPIVVRLSMAMGLAAGQERYALPGQTSVNVPLVVSVAAPTQKSLSLAEQAQFLNTRLPGNMIGSFGGFASLLFAMEGTAIGSSYKDVLHRPLHTVYPNKEIYQPTYSEFFDMIARQTGTSFKYQPEVNVWLFDEPSMSIPYSLSKVEGWKEEDRGMYIAYIPPVAPVGMDIYMVGRYSDLSDAQARKIRDIMALRFSRHISPDVGISDMKVSTVDGADAIYFESAAPQPDRYWRQWAFFKNGQIFVIVSSYNSENKAKIESDVNTMVKSFRVN